MSSCRLASIALANFPSCLLGVCLSALPTATRSHSSRTRSTRSTTFPLLRPTKLRPTKLWHTITTLITAPLTRWYASLVAPKPHDLSTAALSASSLLTAFAAASLPPNGRLNPVQKQRLDAALVALLAIRANVSERYDVQGEDLTVDAGCVICYAEVVDTVLMPCRHMVVCAVGCFSGSICLGC